MEVSFGNAFSQSVLFRVHEGANIVSPSDFLLKVGGDSASCSIAEIIPFLTKSCAMYGPSRLNNDVAASSTLIHSSGTARLGGYTRHCGGSFP